VVSIKTLVAPKKTSKKNEQKLANIVHIYDICEVIRKEGKIELYQSGIFITLKK
jgi:hypothetical protein